MLRESAGSGRDLREGGRWTFGQRLKNDLIYLAIRALLAVLVPGGAALRRGFFALLGELAAACMPRARAAARARLEAGLGAGRGLTVRRCFRAAGAVLADTVALLDPAEPAARSLSLCPRGAARFAEALSAGRGVVFVAAHLGSWERMGALLAARFPVRVVARESYDPRVTALYEALRAPRGVRAIYRGRPGAPFAILRALGRGEAVGFLVDLPGRVPTTEVRLFGAAARLPIGPIRIALARECPVLFGAPEPGRGGSVVRIRRVRTDDLAPGPRGERVLAARIARALEASILRAPEAWLGLFVLRAEGEPSAPSLARNESLPRGGPRALQPDRIVE